MSQPHCDPALNLDNQFCFVLYALSRRITAHYRPLLQAIGLTYPQYLVMLVMWEQQSAETPASWPGVTIKFLGDRLLLDTGTLTPLLKRLQQSGILTRTRSQTDEREVQIRLTEQGVALQEKARHIPLQMLCNSRLPLERIVPLQQQLKQLLVLTQDIE